MVKFIKGADCLKTYPILEGKVAIVTGAAMGMGEATAKLFAEAGAKVVIADFNEEKGKEVTEEILSKGQQAHFVKVDVSNSEQVENMVNETVEKFGRLDVAVNNAAITPDDKILSEMDESYWDRLLSVDLTGVALCLKYELQQLVKQGEGGSIINISSVSGFRPQPQNPAYIAAKHGVVGLTKSAAFDYGKYNIRVNSVAPGAVDTPMLRGAMEQFNLDPVEYPKQLSVLERFAQPVEIAQASLWLASDYSSYVTGTTLHVDGGYTAM